MNTLSIQEKIQLEKRKRNQAYISLDYQLNLTSFFDFFSADALRAVQTAKYIAYSNHQEEVTLEDFVITFCYVNSDLLSILNEFGISQQILMFSKSSNKEKGETKQNLTKTKLNLNWLKSKIFLNLTKLKREIIDIHLLIQNEHRKMPNFSDELNDFFERANENALNKFKTPVVTLDILFFTLIDENKNFASFIEKTLKTDLSFDFLKYRIYQRIHKHESNIHELIPPNYHYFAYLLKSQLTEIEFDYLIENEVLYQSLLYFRNLLIAKALEQDIFPLLRYETQRSMDLTRFRKYSS